MRDFDCRIEYLGYLPEAKIHIMREDLIPEAFGGSKVRIAAELLDDCILRGCDRIISYGSLSSNMNRAVALTAAKAGMRCTVVMKEEERAGEGVTANEELVRASGADICYCRKDHVRETVAAAMEAASLRGEKPYYIYGDSEGRGNESVLMLAYVKAARSIAAYEDRENISFDHIFLAAGTGYTMSGIIAGLGERDLSVHGISVARPAGLLQAQIRRCLEIAGRGENRFPSFEVTDEFLCGGYGESIPDLERELGDFEKHHGIRLNRIYSGKAWYGMKSLILRGDVSGHCLFIHTGGL